MDFLIGLYTSFLALFGFTNVEPVVDVPLTEVGRETAEVIMESKEVAIEAKENTPVISPVIESKTETKTEAKVETKADLTKSRSETMLVAGGCFWCVESDLEKTPGVISAVSGYAGGEGQNPTYRNYGALGHREVVEVTYDPSVVSFEEILIVTLKTTDPTDDDGTFADRGDKYSAAFYYDSLEQKEIINKLIAEVNEFGPYDKPLAIDIETRPTFFKAEDEHQDYYKGTLTKLKYQYYRNASGRNTFIAKYWGSDTTPKLAWRKNVVENTNIINKNMWLNYKKPNQEVLKQELDDLTYKVTQEEGTERAGTSPLDKIYEPGIYVDILSGEPLFSSKDKYDSGTGWPSFTKSITDNAVTKHEDKKLFSTRTEIRSTISDNHLGHVFNDGPTDKGGERYCMNGVALRFIPKAEMEALGYVDYLSVI